MKGNGSLKYFYFLQVLLFIIIPAMLPAQDSSQAKKSKDSSSLLQAFKKGETEGHFRLYYMTTNNEDPLTDYFALAFGGGLRYETKSFKGFQLGVGGFFIWNIASSDLTKPDTVTGVLNRYEVGQFDQENPLNKKDMQRLENFYIRFNYKKSFIRFGKQVIKTPFINPQDGRMRPTGEQGFWFELNEIKNAKIELGWITHISPRGTVKWYRGARSLGIYPVGVNISGTKSEYRGNLESKGIAVAGITYNINDAIKLQAWDHLVQNIFNTILLQADAEFPVEKKGRQKIISGLQYIHQDAIGDGGNADPVKTFFDPSQTVNILGAQIGYRINRSAARLNYSRITKDGRFLFPREWGREPLYTFLPRERNEGLGDTHAFTLNLLHDFKNTALKSELSYGYYDTPDVSEARLNKYGFPSYHQVNFNLKYSFDGFMKGLNAELLYLYKKGSGEMYNDYKFVINKVNMHQFNLVLNYYF